MVAIYREQLSGVVLVPTGTISGVSSEVIETGIPGVMQACSTRGGGVVVQRYQHLLIWCHPLAFPELYSLGSYG